MGLVKDRITRRFRSGYDSVAGLTDSVSSRTRSAARTTDYFVHDNAWTMIGVAAGLAFAAGFLFSSRNQQAIAAGVDADGSSPEVQEKVKRLNSWEFIHSALPLTLFLWKAVQASRCARKGMV
jgi:hypothetical protein